MRKIAHIINPFKADPESDLHFAQPVTFESMRIAREMAREVVDIELLSAQFTEDREIVPDYISLTEDLERSVSDLHDFENPRKYPLIVDILDRLYKETDAEYLVYTNVDIALMPNFYVAVNDMIEAGHDALIINRRRIPARYHRVEELPRMWAEPGKSHPGFDCFVFLRDLYPRFRLENICIGVPFIGITLSQNVFCYAKSYKLEHREHLTFHLGMEKFMKRAPRQYFRHNQKEFWKAIEEMSQDLDVRKFPFFRWPLPFRLIIWGLHPSIPIRLALKLEKRRLLGE